MIFDYEELIQRREGLKRLLTGFRTLISSPDTTSEVKKELEEERVKNEGYLKAVEDWLKATDALMATGYPEHQLGVASPEVIEAIKSLVATVNLVPQDYQAPVALADGGRISEYAP